MGFVVIIAAIAMGVVGQAEATTVAWDTASDPVYDLWDTGDNGGTGFGAWTLSGSFGNSGHFVGSSTINGNGDSNSDGDIDTPTERAWGLWSHPGYVADAKRPFDSSLLVGDTFRIDMDSGWVEGNPGTVGFALQNSLGENLWEYYFVGGEATYTVNDGGGPQATGLGFTDEGMRIDFTLGAGDTYSVTVTTREGNSETLGGSLMAAGGGSDVSGVRLFNAGAGGGSPRNLSFNSMGIDSVPDAGSTLGLLGLTLAALGALRRRR